MKKTTVSSGNDEALSAVAFKRIIGMIDSGQLRAGQQFSHRKLASMCRMSTAPIAAACRKLEDAGIIVVQPRRGCSVAICTLDDVWDALQFRLAVEQRAAILACRYATEEDFDELKRLTEIADFRVPGLVDQPGYNDWVYHRQLLVCSHSKVLLEQTQKINFCMMRTQLCPELLPYLHRKPYLNKDGSHKVMDSHRRLTKVLLERKPVAAAQAVEHHICSAISSSLGEALQTASIIDD